MTTHFMLDSESWGLDSSSVVRQVAITPFEIAGTWVGAPMSWFPDQQEQIERGRILQPSTVRWWQEDVHPDVQKRVEIAEQQERVPCRQMIRQIQNLIYANPASRIFCRNVAHDKPMLESLFRSFHEDIPWQYDSWRDVYCYVDGFGVDIRRDEALQVRIDRLHTAKGLPCLKHEAVSDTLAQIESLFTGLAYHGITEIY